VFVKLDSELSIQLHAFQLVQETPTLTQPQKFVNYVMKNVALAQVC
jgi:hypothetical protein